MIVTKGYGSKLLITVGYGGSALSHIFYTVIKAGKRLVLPVGTVRRYIAAAMELKEHIEAKMSVRRG